MADNKETDDKEYFSATIKSLVPINELSPQLQNEVVNVCNILKFKKKEFVFKQGDRDDYSFYLLEGEVEMVANNTVQSTLQSNSDSARYAMARLQPRQFSAKAKTPITIMQINRAALDRLMVAEQEQNSEQLSGGVEVEVSHIDQEDSGDWMTKMLQSELFCRLPTANIHQLFALLEPVEFEAGATVIKQGDVGENYYIIQEGQCEVTRAPSPGAKPIKLAELRSGDSFGEEALLTDAKRNANIIMKTNGVLMQLSKVNFINLIKKPTLDEIAYSAAKKLVAEGAEWLDVRFQNEYEESHIEGSTNIPMNILRMQTDKLEQGKKYVIYCDTGGRSSAAAFLLTDRGYDVSYLKEGLNSVPQSELKTATTGEAPSGTAAAVEKITQPAPEPEIKEGEQEEANDPELERDIRASVLEVNLERTNLDLKEAMEKVTEGDEKSAREIKEVQKKLLAEKKKLEAEKQAIEKEAKKMREQEASKIKKMKEEAEKRLADEKKKLEDIYTRNTKEMEKMQRMKEQVEEQLKKEREKFEKEASEAKKKNLEADKLKQQLEATRQALEQEAQKKRAEQDAREQEIQAKARAKLEAEKRKLAEEFARTSEEMEKAKKAQAMAEAARRAAQEEARSIIDDYKKQFEQERAKEQQRMQEERKKLEEESRKIQETLKEIQNTRQEAEAAKAAAIEEAQKLRARQNDEAIVQDTSARKQVEAEIKAAEKKLQQAEKNLESVQQAEVSMSAARELNEEELQRQKEEEERIRKEVEADLAEFSQEFEAQEKEKASVDVQAVHAKRIRERASAAKKEAEKATDDLFADIASQLGQDD